MTAQLKVAVSVSSSVEPAVPAVPAVPVAPSELGAAACAEAVAAVVEALAWAVLSEAFSTPSVAAQGYQLTAWR